MTPDQLRELRTRAERLAEAKDSYVAVMLQPSEVIALLDEIERLRIHAELVETREKQATETCTWLTGENQKLRDAVKLIRYIDSEIDEFLADAEDDCAAAVIEQNRSHALEQRLTAVRAARDEACRIAEQILDRVGALDRNGVIAALRKVGADHED